MVIDTGSLLLGNIHPLLARLIGVQPAENINGSIADTCELSEYLGYEFLRADGTCTVPLQSTAVRSPGAISGLEMFLKRPTPLTPPLSRTFKLCVRYSSARKKHVDGAWRPSMVV